MWSMSTLSTFDQPPPEPYSLFDRWYEEARLSGEDFFDAVTLATADLNAKPRVRTMLFKGRQGEDFLFYTNYQSKKAEHLRINPQASLLFFWKSLYRQIRLDGEVQPMSAADSDAYWKTRPRESQIAAWASKQSQSLKSREELENAIKDFRLQFKDVAEIPRPEHWGGFRLRADRIEFWQGRDFRVHERVEFIRSKDESWETRFLFP